MESEPLRPALPAARPEAFPKSRRLRRRREFQQTYKTGRKFFGRHFVVFHVPAGDPPPHLGVTVTKRVGGSVERNRVRRQVREIFRRFTPPAGARGDLVVNVREGAPDVPFTALRADLLGLFARAFPGAP